MNHVDNSQLTGTWILDPSHSRIGFNSRHAMVTKVRGAFNDISGRAVLDLENSDASRVEVDVRMDSIDTRSAQRDEHLRSAEFFDTATYPMMTFRSEHVEEVDDGGFIVTGDLTIHGITRSMSIPLSFTGIALDHFGNLRAGFEGTRRIDRRDWGVTWNTPLDTGGLLISDKIVLEFELSLIKEEAEQSPAGTTDGADAGSDAPAAEAQGAPVAASDPASAAEQHLPGAGAAEQGVEAAEQDGHPGSGTWGVPPEAPRA